MNLSWETNRKNLRGQLLCVCFRRCERKEQKGNWRLGTIRTNKQISSLLWILLWNGSNYIWMLFFVVQIFVSCAWGMENQQIIFSYIVLWHWGYGTDYSVSQDGLGSTEEYFRHAIHHLQWLWFIEERDSFMASCVYSFNLGCVAGERCEDFLG